VAPWAAGDLFRIIGAGNVGRALAGSIGRAGHPVTLSAADPDHAAAVAQATGARAADSNQASRRARQC
jgi:3-hydroxyisobutyrate dehydrogenase-like beta-hydroxyacid dehydrogenase